MRKYLFRGKSKETGKWVQGDMIHEPYGIMIQYYETIPPQGSGAPEREGIRHRRRTLIIPETLGASIELPDAEKCQIFEGDYLARWENEQWTILGVVAYCNDPKSRYAGQYILQDSKGAIADWWDGDWSEMQDLEVFGNIHDNPDRFQFC